MSGQISSKIGQIIKPGGSLVKAATALESHGRSAGKWPYQWLFPGPNSQQVLASGAQALPGEQPTVFTTLCSYTVPEGYRFVLRGVIFDYLGTGWNEGSGDLLFYVQVISGGSRYVDFLQAIATRLGSTRTGPFPILGRLEFNSLDVLNVLVVDVAVPTAAANIAFGALCGHIYPQSESV